MTPDASGDALVEPFDIEAIFPDDAAPGTAPAVRLPRRQAGAAQDLAITLIADYTLTRRAWLPSAALVTMLNAFGITDAAARTVISRLSRRGLLEGGKDGRRSRYRLTEPVAVYLSIGGRWVASFEAEPEPWDGNWTLVAYSLPQEETYRRRRLRGQLRWHGFAPLYDGLWVSARPPDAVVENELKGVTGGATTLFRARHVDLGAATGRGPLAAWDLDAVTAMYAEFLQIWTPVADRAALGRIEGEDAVRARTEVMDTYRRFPLLDPRLPAELLPPQWPRGRAREVFMAVYDGLAGAAEAHVRRLAVECGAKDDGIRAHTVADLLAGLGCASNA